MPFAVGVEPEGGMVARVPGSADGVEGRGVCVGGVDDVLAWDGVEGVGEVVVGDGGVGVGVVKVREVFVCVVRTVGGAGANLEGCEVLGGLVLGKFGPGPCSDFS